MIIKKYKSVKSKKIAFTLVELIVVIMILAILGTIAFISLQGYSQQSRDSTRISDISSIKTTLELFQIESGKYPIPTNGVDITYSGAIVWSQGSFGETVYANVDKLDKIPLDPLSNSSYTYSITQGKNEYQLGGIVEGDIISYYETKKSDYKVGELAQIANAGNIEAKAYISGNYNGQMTKSLSGTNCNIFSIPTIIASDIETSTDLEEISNNRKFVYIGEKNLPNSFRNSKFKFDGGFNFKPNKLIAYSDTGSCNNLLDKTEANARIQLLTGLQESYSGTTLKDKGEIRNILALNINTNNPSSELLKFASNFVNNNLGGKIAIEGKYSYTIENICNTQPSYSNATFTQGNPTEVNQAWQNTNDTDPCYYTCNSGYEWDGNDCNIICNAGETRIRGLCTDTYNDNVLLYLPMTGTDGSTAFTDHSIYNRTVSRSGNSSIKTNITDPFGGNSGVGYFDGNGDYLTTAISGIGANDFTLETFIYRTQNVVDIDVVAEFDGTINFEVRPGNQSFGLRINGTYITTPNVMSLNTWHHVAYTKQGSTRRVFIDGIQRTSTTKSMTLGNMNLNIGDDPSVTNQNRDFAGYMSNFRLTNGLARYTSGFTPPTRPFAQRLNMTGGYFSGYGSTSSGWKKANGDSLKNCQEYNLQATTYNDGINRGTGLCGNGSQECLYDGVYSIDPDGAGGNAPFNVFCGMTTSIDGIVGGWTLMATKNDTDRNAIIANWGTTLNNSTVNSNNIYKGNWSDLSYNYMVYDIANYNYKFLFDMTGMSNTTKDYSKDAVFLNYGDMYDSGKTLTCKSINNGNTYPHCGSYTSPNRYRWKGLVGDPGYPWCRFYSPPDGGQGTGGCAASPANNKGRIWVR